MDGIPYDPSWLVNLAIQQFPTESKLHEALRACTSASVDGEVTYFVDRMEGKFAFNVTLFSAERGRVVLDVLKDGRIGGFSVIETPLQAIKPKMQ